MIGEAITAGDSTAGLKALRFVEKPDLATARAYVADGSYYWNGGMFCFTAGAFLDALANLTPEALSAGAKVSAA